MNVNYELYKIFFVVANSNTITEAAKKLFISQPAITKSIKNLEKQLNVTLFIRNTKGTKLTKEGKEFYKQIKPAIEQLLIAEQKLSLKQDKKRKKLTIGISDTFLQQYIAKALKKFINRNNQVKISIYEQNPNLLLSKISNDYINIGIAPLNEQEIVNTNLNTNKIDELHFCIIENIYSSNILNNSKNINKKIICNDLNIIKTLYPENPETLNYLIVDSYNQIYELVLQNIGIGIIPKEFLNHLKDNKVVILKEDIYTTNIYLITNSIITNHNSLKLQKLIIEENNKFKQPS